MISYRRANGPILAAVAWGTAAAGFRCPSLFFKAASQLMLNDTGVRRMAPGPLQQLLWAAAVSRCYSQSLFKALCGKLEMHVGRRPSQPASAASAASLAVGCLWALSASRHYDVPVVEAACRTLGSPLPPSPMSPSLLGRSKDSNSSPSHSPGLLAEVRVSIPCSRCEKIKLHLPYE